MLRLSIYYYLLVIMMANNLGFKPAMSTSLTNLVLDPVTMTPMMSGGSITVNPLGMAGMHFTERASFAKHFYFD